MPAASSRCSTKFTGKAREAPAFATPKYTEQQQVADDLAALPVIDAPLQQPN